MCKIRSKLRRKHLVPKQEKVKISREKYLGPKQEEVKVAKESAYVYVRDEYCEEKVGS